MKIRVDGDDGTMLGHVWERPDGRWQWQALIGMRGGLAASKDAAITRLAEADLANSLTSMGFEVSEDV